MRILWLGRRHKDLNSPAMPHLRDALGKLAHVELSTINEKYNEENHDVVILGPICADLPYYKIKGWKIPKVMICSDPQSDLLSHKTYAKEYNVDLALLIYSNWINEYKKHLSCQVGWLPFCLSDVYSNTYKDITLSCAIANGPLYPIRLLMKKDKRLHRFIRVEFGIQDKRLEWTKYIEILNRSKILVFDNSTWDFTILKWLEGFSTNNLVMTPIPADGEKTHFKPYYNFIPITQTNYFEKICEYVENDKERVKIAGNGRKTFLKYHTSTIRAKQLYTKLKKLLNKQCDVK